MVTLNYTFPIAIMYVVGVCATVNVDTPVNVTCSNVSPEIPTISLSGIVVLILDITNGTPFQVNGNLTVLVDVVFGANVKKEDASKAIRKLFGKL